MFNIIYRRLQKYSLWIKLLLLVCSGSGFGALIYYTPPQLSFLLLAVLLAWIFLLMLLSFVINIRSALILSIGASFLVFLKAVDLLTPINLVLLSIFLILLSFYFRNPKQERPTGDAQPLLPKEVLFPKGWPFRVAKKRKEE